MKKQGLWLFCFLAGLGFLLFSEPLSKRMNDAAQDRILSLRREKAEKLAQIDAWKADIAEAERLRLSIGAEEMEKVLAPANRNALAEFMESMAEKLKFRPFAFSLSPFAVWSGDAAFPALESIAQSKLALTFDAPEDKSVFRFLDALAGQTGRMDMEELTLERVSGEKLTSQNIRVKASLVWLANSDEGKRP